MALLSKNDILKGINNIQKVEIESLGGEIYLRPLSEAELQDLDLIEAKAMGVYESTQKGRSDTLNKGKINLAKATEASNEARIKKIELSINNEKNAEDWTPDEIKSLSRETINELNDKIDELSGVEIKKRDVEKFPEE